MRYFFFFFLANGVDFHNLAYLATSTSKRLSDVGEWTAANDLLIRLHGALMLASWIGTASIGMLLARYYRQTWVNSQLCGKDHWFAVSAKFSSNIVQIFYLTSFLVPFQNYTMLHYPFLIAIVEREIKVPIFLINPVVHSYCHDKLASINFVKRNCFFK